MKLAIFVEVHVQSWFINIHRIHVLTKMSKEKLKKLGMLLIDYTVSGIQKQPCHMGFFGVREVTKNNTPILPVFLSVFCVATMEEYFNILPLSRLEYKQKPYVIRVYYFL